MGVSYFHTILDDYSRVVLIYLIFKKIRFYLKRIFSMLTTQLHKNIKVVQSDNWTEFVCLKSYFLENGMLHQKTTTVTLNKMDKWSASIIVF